MRNIQLDMVLSVVSCQSQEVAFKRKLLHSRAQLAPTTDDYSPNSADRESGTYHRTK